MLVFGGGVFLLVRKNNKNHPYSLKWMHILYKVNNIILIHLIKQLISLKAEGCKIGQ